MSFISDHVSICICTYKRPEMLDGLLEKLQELETENLFSYSIVVIDNDSTESAKSIVKIHQEKSVVDIEYFCEPQQNISHARNKAVEMSKGVFIAFIDDDEFPEKIWLQQLLKIQKRHNAVGVLGPVRPYFNEEPPSWIIKSRICERPEYATGTKFKHARKMRTGNVLLKKELFLGMRQPFNPKFGITGGEDVDFFSRMLKNDMVFIWCNEACVYEIVTPDRFKKRFYLKRALLAGDVTAGKSSFFSMRTGRTAFAFFIYSAFLPVLYFAGEHHFMKYLIKDCHHIGYLLGIIGLKKIIRER